MKERKSFLVAGLGFGDEGKGTTVDFLTRKYNAHTVIRYNGGAQAFHNVVTKNGRQHGFAQFGSGTFVPGVKTHLSRFTIINPETMVNEERHLKELGIYDSFARTTIDGDALVATPYHKIINRLREIARNDKRHGSCGMGIGEAITDSAKYGNSVLLVKNLKDQKLTRKKLEFIRWEKIKSAFTLDLPDTKIVSGLLENLDSDLYMGEYLEFYKFFAAKLANIVGNDYLPKIISEGTAIFEGAQGILLDPKFGFPPHVTKTDITFDNALTLLKEASYDGRIERVGVLRSYFTRHGAGPFLTEDETMTRLLPDSHNNEGPWQGKFRVGYFDGVLANYAISSLGFVDDLMLTNLDRLVGIEPLKICTHYNPADQKPVYENISKTDSKHGLIQYVEVIKNLGIPVSMLSFGPTAEDKIIT